MLAWGVLFGDGDVLSAGKTDHDYVLASAWRLCTVGHSMIMYCHGSLWLPDQAARGFARAAEAEGFVVRH
jgi:hypothetical protein